MEKRFEIGRTYTATMTTGYEFNVTIDKRTEKSVWISSNDFTNRRVKISHFYKDAETLSFDCSLAVA